MKGTKKHLGQNFMGNSTAKIKHNKSSSLILIQFSLPPENLVIPSRNIYLCKGEGFGE